MRRRFCRPVAEAAARHTGSTGQVADPVAPHGPPYVTAHGTANATIWLN
jgi:hypothetical protein